MSAAGEVEAYLRTFQVAQLLHVSPKTVTRWACEGRLPFVFTVGGHRRYPADGIRDIARDLDERSGPRRTAP